MAISNVVDPFVRQRNGVLMKMDANPQTQYTYRIWFEYTRQTMMDIKEGRFLIAKNYATEQSQEHYTILQVISSQPVHYALGTNPDGYPGFLMETARNISQDWVNQEAVAQEDTTIIICDAAPTRLGLTRDTQGLWQLESDQSLPMIGSVIKVLTSEAAKEIINTGMDVQLPKMQAGLWLVDQSIPVEAFTEDFIKVHFGIFGFTGVGKSNLVSTYISKIINEYREKNIPVKIVLFDMMSEYTTLLIDHLISVDDAFILALDEKAVTGNVISFLKGNRNSQQLAVRDMVRTTLMPKSLEPMRAALAGPMDVLLTNNKIKVHNAYTSLRVLIQLNRESVLSSLGNSNCRFNIRALLNNIENHPLAMDIDATFIGDTITAINNLLNDTQPTPGANQNVDALFGAGTTAPITINTGTRGNNAMTPSGQGALERLRIEVARLLRNAQNPYRPGATISTPQLIDKLNDRTKSTLIVVQTNLPDRIREFASELGDDIYEDRRTGGTTDPLVSMIFDEADEFIPNDRNEEGSSYAASAQTVETLARRGRKFGLGIGICTQRTRHLDTSVMAQPHTYLVSRLPRKGDRDIITDAFGLPEEMFAQTFKFSPGNWLLTSYDATGMKGVPIPIKTDDANKRISDFLSAVARAGQDGQQNTTQQAAAAQQGQVARLQVGGD